MHILIAAVALTFYAYTHAAQISVSTRLEALMPQGAPSVQTLNHALRKTGSFASIQIAAHSDDPGVTLQFIKDAKQEIDQFDWVESSQYFEDIDVLESHKLLLLSMEELLQLEADVDAAYPNLMAQEISKELGADVTVTLRDENLAGDSRAVIDDNWIEQLSGEVTGDPQTERLFVSEDGLTVVLVVWPKPGLEALTDSKRMVEDAFAIVAKLDAPSYGSQIQVGVAGRIANKVAQFDAIIGDLKLGLLGSITLIALLIGLSFRSWIAIPAIFIPLIIGIVWAMGMTAVTIGGLNLITIFLTLILFGLGIDFGIHNFSRYREERRLGKSIEQATEIIITSTGGASLIAALTTSIGFFSLTLTDFRAFTEFGFIAGSGVLLIFVSMYSVFPALMVVLEKLGDWSTKAPAKSLFTQHNMVISGKKNHRIIILGAAGSLLIFAAVFAPQVAFERNFKNLQAEQPQSLQVANELVRNVFPDGHDRAIIVVETYDELYALDVYFKSLIEADTQTPTIKRVSSLLDFVPNQKDQESRLEVIKRLEKRNDTLRGLTPEKYASVGRYLSIEDLNITDLPPALKRTYLGTGVEPGYLMYVYNSVSMDDSAVARLFYDDAATVIVGDREYASASESFIFVEMLALMKADAVKAILLVIIATALLVFLFIRSVSGALVVLIPPLLGVLVTLGVMGAFGPRLSIMNMVILPSLIGISVDNSIHIFHRFRTAGKNVDIAYIMNSTGRAAVITTLTTLLGFGGMVTASMGGLRGMGLLAIIGFTACLVMTWLLLPVLLELYAKWNDRKKPA
ncbi:MAG: MMPL family transporter [Robiginitomaculum sp.]|nr:MMPL family transporter [Robiginitomaculum sp.]